MNGVSQPVEPLGMLAHFRRRPGSCRSPIVTPFSEGGRSLNVEIPDTLFEAQVLVERWRKHYNTVRPHSSLGYRPPARRGPVAHRVEALIAGGSKKGTVPQGLPGAASSHRS